MVKQQKRGNMSLTINNLPNEMLVAIFTQLNNSQRGAVKRVNFLWNFLINASFNTLGCRLEITELTHKQLGTHPWAYNKNLKAFSYLKNKTKHQSIIVKTETIKTYFIEKRDTPIKIEIKKQENYKIEKNFEFEPGIKGAKEIVSESDVEKIILESIEIEGEDIEINQDITHKLVVVCDRKSWLE